MENTSDNLIYSWMPNCDRMLNMILHNDNIPFYPSQDNFNTYKAFDFTTQRNFDEDEDFISIDQKQALAKQKKQTKKPTTVNVKKPIKQQPASTKQRMTQTITIKPEWKSIADFNKQGLEKLRLDFEPEVEDVSLCGVLYKISEEFEKDGVNPLNPIQLQRFENFKFFGNLTTLADEKMKNSTDIANVFVTDKILSVIMTMVFNSRPWHLEITKVGESIFIDKKNTSEVDLITVNESSDNIPPEDNDPKNIDSFNNLAVEATLINEFIKEQILDTSTKNENIEQPHPFAEDGDDNERLAYRYRIWRLGDVDVLVRCQVHSYDYNDDQDMTFVNIYALNEYEKSTYKSQELSMSHHFRKELLNNHLKITKWGVQSYLSGVDTIKMGFVTRTNTKSNSNHTIVGFSDININDLLFNTNFNKQIAWGIFKQIIDLIRTQSDGTFILMKTLSGSKPMVKLFKIPQTIESSEQDNYE